MATIIPKFKVDYIMDQPGILETICDQEAKTLKTLGVIPTIAFFEMYQRWETTFQSLPNAYHTSSGFDLIRMYLQTKRDALLQLNQPNTPVEEKSEQKHA